MDTEGSFSRKWTRLFILCGFLLSSAIVNGQHGWTVNPADYAFNGELNAVVILDGADVTTGSLGAFVGTECRGYYDEPDYSPISDRYYFPVTVYSNQASGETLTFQYYDGSEYYDISETVEFVSNMQEGDAANPLEFNALSNSQPVVDNPIADQVYDEYFGSATIDLDTIFSDPDAGDVLTYTASSDNSAVVTTSISSNILTINEAGPGTANITVTATDNGDPVLDTSDVFQVTVNDINGAPTVDSPIADQGYDEYFTSATIDLTGVFSDPDPGDALTYSATSDDEAVVTVGVTGTTLTITEVGLGTANITVTATDDGTPVLSTTDEFQVSINDINGNPVVDNPIPDQVYDEYFTSATIDLDTIFSDPDAGDALTYTASSDNSAVVTTGVSGSILTINEAGLGSANITVTATDDGSPVLDATDGFQVTVNNVNEAPVIDNPVADISVDEYFGTLDIDVTNVFSDPDAGDVLTLEVSSSDETVVTASLAGTTVTLTEAGLGTATISLTATDDGEGTLSTTDQFLVTVNNVNETPTYDTPIPDQVLDEYFSSLTIDLDTVFTDPDAGDLLTYAATSDDASVVTTATSGSILTITEAGLGTANITVTATDDGTPVLDTTDVFQVTVNNVNDAPIVVSPLPDISEDEGYTITTVDLRGVFTDIDPGDNLTWSAESSDETIVTVSVTDTILTIIEESGIGTVTITVSATDNSGVSTEDDFEFTIVSNLPAGWTYDPTDYSFNGQVTAKVFLENVEVTSGYLGAFAGSECRGVIRATYFIPSDHYVFELIAFSNNSTGDTLSFRYYDPQSGEVYDLHEEIEFTPDMIMGNAVNPVELNYCFAFTKSLTTGWNWFSINVIQPDMSLEVMMPDCVAEGDYIKNQTTSATYYEGSGWFGSLEELDPTTLYKTYLEEACVISTCGASIDLDTTTIEVTDGWNYVGYLAQEPQPIADALSSLPLVELDYIKSQVYTATYYDGVGWFGSLTEMSPGEGYMVNLANPGTLQYPEPSSKKSVAASGTGRSSELNPHAFRHSGTVTAKVFMDGELTGSREDKLMAYVDGELRGEVNGLYFFPEDAFAFQMLIYSNVEEGEEVRFRYYDAESGQTYHCEETLEFRKDMIVADAYQSFELNVSATGARAISTGAGFRLQTYPNPFSDRLRIRFSIDEPSQVKVAVYDLLGQEVEILSSDNYKTGSHQLEWNATGHPAGTYIIRATTDSGQMIKRVSLID